MICMSSSLCFSKSSLLYFFKLKFIIIAIKNWMLKSDNSFPYDLNMLKIIGMIPNLIMSILGYLEKENLCKIPKMGLRHPPYYLQLLKRVTKFYINFFDFVRYCRPIPSVVIISISLI